MNNNENFIKTDKAKKEIFLFLFLLVILSGISYFLISQSEAANVEDSPITLLLVYSPFLAAIITRLITDNNLKKLGWRFVKGKYLFISFLIPVIAGVIVYGFAWLTKFGYLNENVKIGLGSNLPMSLDFLIFCALG